MSVSKFNSTFRNERKALNSAKEPVTISHSDIVILRTVPCLANGVTVCGILLPDDSVSANIMIDLADGKVPMFYTSHTLEMIMRKNEHTVTINSHNVKVESLNIPEDISKNIYKALMMQSNTLKYYDCRTFVQECAQAVFHVGPHEDDNLVQDVTDLSVGDVVDAQLYTTADNSVSGGTLIIKEAKETPELALMVHHFAMYLGFGLFIHKLGTGGPIDRKSVV